jgi:predicted nucleotidyltransferase
MEVGRVTVDQKALEELCRRHHIRKLSLFGSVLSGADRADSDIDLLVEFEDGKAPDCWAGAMEDELSALLVAGESTCVRPRT